MKCDANQKLKKTLQQLENSAQKLYAGAVFKRSTPEGRRALKCNKVCEALMGWKTRLQQHKARIIPVLGEKIRLS
jgi:hypothetical protein